MYFRDDPMTPPPVGVVMALVKEADWQEPLRTPGWLSKMANVDSLGMMLIKLAQEAVEEEQLPPEAEAGIAHQQLAAQAQHDQQAALEAAAQLQQSQAQAAQLQQQAQQMQQQYEAQIQQMQQQLQGLQQQNQQLQQQLQVAQQSSLDSQEQVLQLKKSTQDYRQMLAQLAGTDPTQTAAQAAPAEQPAAGSDQGVPVQALPSDAKKEVEQAQKSQQQAAVQQQQAQQKVQEEAPKIEQAAALAQQNGIKAAAFYLFGDHSREAMLKTAVAIKLMEARR